MPPIVETKTIIDETVKELKKFRHDEDIRRILGMFYAAMRKAEGNRVTVGGKVPRV